MEKVMLYISEFYLFIYFHENEKNTFRRKSKPTISPETTNVRVNASNPLKWFPWNKKATKLTSKNSIPDVASKDKTFHASSFPGVHSHACVNKEDPVLS
jgi:hypothetical protein